MLLVVVKATKLDNYFEKPANEEEKYLMGTMLEVPKIEFMGGIRWEGNFPKLTIRKAVTLVESGKDLTDFTRFDRFSMRAFLNIPFKPDGQHMMAYCRLEFINWFINMKQMRIDYLLKHKVCILHLEPQPTQGINENPNVKTQKSEYMNYMELCKASLNHQLNLQNIKSFWKKMTVLDFKIAAYSLGVIIQKKEPIEIESENFSISGLQLFIDSLLFSAAISQQSVF